MDKIFRGVLNKGKVRIFLADSSFTCKEICELHNLNFNTADILSRVLSITAIMGIMQKMGNLTVKIDSNGPAKGLICESDDEANIRGLVINPNVDSLLKPEETIGSLGILSVVKDFGMKRNFTSQIELISGKIGDDFSYYFRESEQVPSFVSVGTEIKDNVFYSGALIVQLMPGYKEEDILYVENFSKNCPNIRDILKVDDKEGALKELFPEIEILSVHPINFKCNCSKERFINGLTTLKQDEIKEMIDENKDLELRCNFCNKKYVVTTEDLFKIYKKEEAIN